MDIVDPKIDAYLRTLVPEGDEVRAEMARETR